MNYVRVLVQAFKTVFNKAPLVAISVFVLPLTSAIFLIEVSKDPKTLNVCLLTMVSLNVLYGIVLVSLYLLNDVSNYMYISMNFNLKKLLYFINNNPRIDENEKKDIIIESQNLELKYCRSFCEQYPFLTLEDKKVEMPK